MIQYVVQPVPSALPSPKKITSKYHIQILQMFCFVLEKYQEQVKP